MQGKVFNLFHNRIHLKHLKPLSVLHLSQAEEQASGMDFSSLTLLPLSILILAILTLHSCHSPFFHALSNLYILTTLMYEKHFHSLIPVSPLLLVGWGCCPFTRCISSNETLSFIIFAFFWSFAHLLLPHLHHLPPLGTT